MTTAAIIGAVGFAVAQPLYDLLGRNASFFLAHQADGRDLLAFCLLLSLALPAALAFAVAAGEVVDERLGRLAFTVLMATCGALLTLAVCRSFALPGALALAAAAIAVAVTALASRRPSARRGLAVLGIAGLLFPALFLARPDVRALWETYEADSTPEAGPVETPVILVVFDEMPLASLLTPEEEIDAGRYPNLARLAATATWYRQATTVSQATIYSVPAILTGNYPEPNVSKSPTVKRYRPNLFTDLAGVLELNAWETMTHLCPNNLCTPPERWLIPRRERLRGMLSDAAAVYVSLVAPADWGGTLPTLDDQWRDFWGASRAPAADEAPRTMAERSQRPDELFAWFLNTIEQRAAKPTLHYAHVMLPHRPWVWLPNGQRFASYLSYPHGLVNQAWRGSEWETTQAQQRHLLTVGFVDTLVGRLVDTLRRAGIFDDALLVITSDHGGTFRTGGLRRNLRLEPTYEIVRVPLFVKYPRQRAGGVDDRNAETIDIAPTLFAALGLEPTKPLDGTDLAAPPQAKGDRKRTFLSGNKRASAGGILEYSTGEEEGRQAALDEIARRFQTGSWESVFEAGPRPDLLDRRLSDLSVTDAPRGERAEIVDLDAWDDVDPGAELLPIHVFGSLTLGDVGLGNLGPGDAGFSGALALALEGRIRGTTEVFATDEGPAFSSLLPPEALRAGANRLGVLVISGEGDATSLRALEVVHRPREDG